LCEENPTTGCIAEVDLNAGTCPLGIGFAVAPTSTRSNRERKEQRMMVREGAELGSLAGHASMAIQHKRREA
jgi:hypothetical protein